jgi:hypothetical protein
VRVGDGADDCDRLGDVLSNDELLDRLAMAELDLTLIRVLDTPPLAPGAFFGGSGPSRPRLLGQWRAEPTNGPASGTPWTSGRQRRVAEYPATLERLEAGSDLTRHARSLG